MASVFNGLFGREERPIALVRLAEVIESVFGFIAGLDFKVSSVEDSVLIFQEEGADFGARLEHEIRDASGHIDGEVRVTVEAEGDIVNVGFHTSEMRADHT